MAAKKNKKKAVAAPPKTPIKPKVKAKAIPKRRPKPGQPAIWDSPKALQAAVNAYFKKCEAGKPVTVIKKGEPIEVTRRIPKTVTGLCLALNFATRQSLLNYAGKPEYLDIITRAKMEIEQDNVEGGMMSEYESKITALNLASNYGYSTKEEHKIDAGENIMGLVASMINEKMGKK